MTPCAVYVLAVPCTVVQASRSKSQSADARGEILRSFGWLMSGKNSLCLPLLMHRQWLRPGNLWRTDMGKCKGNMHLIYLMGISLISKEKCRALCVCAGAWLWLCFRSRQASITNLALQYCHCPWDIVKIRKESRVWRSAPWTLASNAQKGFWIALLILLSWPSLPEDRFATQGLILLCC